MKAVNLLSGILLIDKPEGITSHGVVSKVRRALNMKKVGHAGTLDPFATGLLVILVGEGTKLSDSLMAGKKRYTAGVLMGEKTDTGDLSGSIVEKKSCAGIDEATVLDVLPRFTGEIKQVPPMYSALKRGGVPLYKMARKGLEVERKPREVFIDRVDVASFDSPLFSIDVECSKGTYIRTLGEDISEAMGTCGHLISLRRLSVGPFSLEDAINIDQLAKGNVVAANLIPLKEALPAMPELVVCDEAERKVSNGQAIRSEWIDGCMPEKITAGEKVKVTSGRGRLLSIAEIIHEMGREVNLPPGFVVGKSLRVFNSL
ncbi:MAG: tRNA pseudouridine(55) synthase TruB [Proteobacteria bacterium]|nr:tRNA pseudouridine(55) synthase TruB [Pseudomonadota bacterium]